MDAPSDVTRAKDLPIRFGPDGLVPVVAQDAISGDVLMLAFMNREALAATQATGRAHYWSRSRGKLWRKGETSGHEQIVDAIYVNCEQTSLLLVVRQLGAVCHDGYPTCYYRRLDPNRELTVVRERAFDPAAVYAAAPVSTGADGDTVDEADRLAVATRRLYGAYAFLRDNDLTAVSATSARLRAPDDQVSRRVADELRELAGVLDGSHRHAETGPDALLEGTQALYWVVLSVLRRQVTWRQLRPDRALATYDANVDPMTVARLLRADAARWRQITEPGANHAARCHATLSLIAQAVAAVGISPLEVVEMDLAALRTKPYLAAYFAGSGELPEQDAGIG